MFTFCPLQGAQSDSRASQSILELDGGVKVLIDLGWDDSFDVENLRELEKQVPTLSLILLTHATTSHLAAFAHCCKHFPLFTRIPVYATRPVIDLGRTLTQDLYSSTPLAATTVPHASLTEAAYSFTRQSTSDNEFLLQSPTPEEITRYFSLIQPLKYSQPHEPLASPFSPPLNGLTITAYNAGHTLGGTIWHIQHGPESIVYAVDWNQARENVFAGAAWLGGAGGGGAEVIEQLRKPTALVCSSRGAEKVSQAGGRTKRDEQLIDMISLCVSRGGTALIPVDSSARVLELAYLLEHAFRADATKPDSSLHGAKLYLAGRNMSSTLRYARSMLEWMDDNIVREFEATADGLRKTNGADGKQSKDAAPFDFRYTRLVERRAQIEKLLTQNAENGVSVGRVILASDDSLQWGFSKDLIKGLAKDAKNLVILTDKPALSRPDHPSIARTLWDWWKERKDGVSVDQSPNGDSIELAYGGGRELTVLDAKRQGLEGEELSIYQQWLATRRQLQSTLQTGGATALESAADVGDDASSESSSESGESDTEQQGKALNISTTMGQATRKKVVLSDEDLGINVLTKKRGASDFDVRGKKGRERSFPLALRRKRDDQFGDIIRPEDYLRDEEKEEENQDAPGPHGDDDNQLGRKRRWDETSNGPNKRLNIQTNVAADGPELAESPDAPAMDELDDVEDIIEEEVQGPAKLVTSSDTVVVNLRIGFVDFSGVHDKRSLNNLIPLIQPRKLILVGGNRDETATLANDCKQLLAAQIGASDASSVDVMTPENGVWVDASVETNAWVVKLADDLVKKLKWQNVHGLGIVTITGQLVVEAIARDKEGGANKRLKTTEEEPVTNGADFEDEGIDVVPTLDTLPMSMVSATRSTAQPLHVGDLRLTDLRRAMQSAGYTAEFRGEGTLVVNGAVAVRKTTTGQIDVESVGVSDAASMMQHRSTFYEVKRMIYDGLAVVAGA